MATHSHLIKAGFMNDLKRYQVFFVVDGSWIEAGQPFEHAHQAYQLAGLMECQFASARTCVRSVPIVTEVEQ